MPTALARAGALLIRDGFVDYDNRFAAITRRAADWFARRDWSRASEDTAERLRLYDICVAETSARLETLLGARTHERAVWQALRGEYATLIASQLDQELFKTFYNTLTRRYFKTRGVSPDIEFVALDIEPTDAISAPVPRRNFVFTSDPARVFARVLAGYRFAVSYVHAERCARRLGDCLQALLRNLGDEQAIALELLDTVFYRERRAYLVGRVFARQRYLPCAIALVNDDDGLRADALLLGREQVGLLFGFTRSYFLADLPTVGDAVVFLRTLLPDKPVDEIYTVLGRAKQGKTERYRHFFRHLEANAQEQLVHAEGERGMVMAVFTLPSYPLVFKLIRDRFAYPKNIARSEVQAKYGLVFHHDRVGRLVDAQEFKFLRFPRAQFSRQLLHELLGECRESVSEDGDDVVIHLCYVERRLRPLNLYVKEVDDEAALAAVLDYGQAIKDLARSNIFPGDLLLKNFGVTRRGRAIFYDYDELCLVTDCRFRPLPEPRNDEEEMHHGAWYYVAENDVFPEQFPRFLGLTPVQREALLRVHGEIFDVAWWQQWQQRLRRGETADVPPYGEALRLRD